MSGPFHRADSKIEPEDYYVGSQAAKVRNQIGWNSSAWFRKDPRAMAYTAAKYFTVAKLLQGKRKVLEIGCGDGFGLPIVAQHVRELFAIEINDLLVTEANAVNAGAGGDIFVMQGDFLSANLIAVPAYDAVYCLDVLEHIAPDREPDFLFKVLESLTPSGVFICGMPTLNSQAWASDYGREGHINCQHPGHITGKLSDLFDNVFSFGLADGQINLGFEPMRQYQLNLCCGPRK